MFPALGAGAANPAPVTGLLTYKTQESEPEGNQTLFSKCLWVDGRQIKGQTHTSGRFYIKPGREKNLVLLSKKGRLF